MNTRRIVFDDLPFITVNNNRTSNIRGMLYIKESPDRYPLFLLKSYYNIFTYAPINEEIHDYLYLKSQLANFDVLEFRDLRYSSSMIFNNILKRKRVSKNVDLELFFNDYKGFNLINKIQSYAKIGYDCGLFYIRKDDHLHFTFGMLSFDSNFKEYMRTLIHYPKMIKDEFYENQIFRFEYLPADQLSEYLSNYHSPNYVSKIVEGYKITIESFIKYFDSFGIESCEVYNFDHFFSYPKPIINSFEDAYKFEGKFRKNLISLYTKFIYMGQPSSRLKRTDVMETSPSPSQIERDELYLRELQVTRTSFTRRTIYSVVNEGVKL